MSKATSIFAIGVVAAISASCANNPPGGATAESAAAHFTINSDTRPKQVDSIAEGGPTAGQVSRGIYEIPDPTHQRACFGPPGGPRPTEFKSSSGSGRTLQYWKKIGPVPSR